jgi:restriction system protein
MARYNYSATDDIRDYIGRVASAAAVLYFLYLIGNWFTNRANFWKMLIYSVLILVLILFGIVYWGKRRENKRRERIGKIIDEIRRAGLEENIKNFINRFGFEGKRSYGWRFRNHVFEWERIDDLERDLLERGISLRADEKQRDIFILLRLYIQQKEETLTRESIKKESQKFANLTGSDFEKLIYRLSNAMGYSTEWIGKSGDQGGDLIANRNGKRLLIQAKCYRDWSTGNEAVQQVVGAMKFYDCSEATVITTSYFTPEAIILAKANNIELIAKGRLQELLLRYLNESWS